MNLVEVPASVMGGCVEYNPLIHKGPFHWGEICMTLDCLAYMVDAVPYIHERIN